MDKITFKNGESGGTPINATNLNQMQTNIESAINTKITQTEVLSTVFKASTTVGDITANSDANFDELKTPGCYHINTWAGSSTGTNFPKETIGLFLIFRTGDLLFQIIFASNKIMLRRLASGTWSAWVSTTLS